jgi:hypothetical protein
MASNKAAAVDAAWGTVAKDFSGAILSAFAKVERTLLEKGDLAHHERVNILKTELGEIKEINIGEWAKIEAALGALLDDIKKHNATALGETSAKIAEQVTALAPDLIRKHCDAAIDTTFANAFRRLQAWEDTAFVAETNAKYYTDEKIARVRQDFNQDAVDTSGSIDILNKHIATLLAERVGTNAKIEELKKELGDARVAANNISIQAGMDAARAATCYATKAEISKAVADGIKDMEMVIGRDIFGVMIEDRNNVAVKNAARMADVDQVKAELTDLKTRFAAVTADAAAQARLLSEQTNRLAAYETKMKAHFDTFGRFIAAMSSVADDSVAPEIAKSGDRAGKRALVEDSTEERSAGSAPKVSRTAPSANGDMAYLSHDLDDVILTMLAKGFLSSEKDYKINRKAMMRGLRVYAPSDKVDKVVSDFKEAVRNGKVKKHESTSILFLRPTIESLRRVLDVGGEIY